MKIYVSLSGELKKGSHVIARVATNAWKVGDVTSRSKEGNCLILFKDSTKARIEDKYIRALDKSGKATVYTTDEVRAFLGLKPKETQKEKPQLRDPGESNRAVFVLQKTRLAYPTYVEGYWKATKTEKSPYAWPVPGGSKPSGFMAKLKQIEEHAGKSQDRGFSVCRLCGEKNGSKEYHIRVNFNGERIAVRWPEGYSHYLSKHKIGPSKEFAEIIMNHK